MGKEENFWRLAFASRGNGGRADNMAKRNKRSMADALELPGDEGRDKLRKAAGRSKYPVIRGLPNGVTRAL